MTLGSLLALYALAALVTGVLLARAGTTSGGDDPAANAVAVVFAAALAPAVWLLAGLLFVVAALDWAVNVGRSRS